MSDRHGWNSWDQYQAIHESNLRRWEHFVADNQLTVTEASTLITWKGALICTDGIEIRVSKIQDVEYRSGRPYVRTAEYSYHVLRRREGVQANLLRYDNAHPHPGHPDAHHRHRYDREGREILPPEHIGEENWPTLGDVIHEAFGIWEQLKRDEEER
jgi:hypothetical protein